LGNGVTCAGRSTMPGRAPTPNPDRQGSAGLLASGAADDSVPKVAHLIGTAATTGTAPACVRAAAFDEAATTSNRPAAATTARPAFHRKLIRCSSIDTGHDDTDPTRSPPPRFPRSRNKISLAE
jgi:hypothetical protein